MKSKSLMFLCILVCLGLLGSCQTAKGAKCGPDQVWVPGYRAANGAWVKGWCRPAAKSGYVWVPGQTARSGRWVPGHWKPVKPGPKGKTWVPGHRAPNGRWVPGHYRDGCGPGRQWVPGHRGRRGRWVPGHCR